MEYTGSLHEGGGESYRGLNTLEAESLLGSRKGKVSAHSSTLQLHLATPSSQEEQLTSNLTNPNR